jgi:hypothetical protein
MWKNRHADGATLSAKKPAKVKRRQREEREARVKGAHRQEDNEVDVDNDCVGQADDDDDAAADEGVRNGAIASPA